MKSDYGNLQLVRRDVVEVGDVSLEVFCYYRARVTNEHLSDQGSVVFGKETLYTDQPFPLRSSSTPLKSHYLHGTARYHLSKQGSQRFQRLEFQ